MVQRGRAASGVPINQEGAHLSACRSQTPPRSAPSSPLKIYWNADQGSSPERLHGSSHHLSFCHGDHALGLSGDVVLPDVPMNMTGREISGMSNSQHSDGYEQDTMSGSVGEMQTWRSVGDLVSLDGGEEKRGGSRAVSDES
jgi:hypothetical protein